MTLRAQWVIVIASWVAIAACVVFNLIVCAQYAWLPP